MSWAGVGSSAANASDESKSTDSAVPYAEGLEGRRLGLMKGLLRLLMIQAKIRSR
jgi:hypothetical protein